MPGSAWPSRRRLRSTCCRDRASPEPFQQRPRGAPTVADRVLALSRELRHRQASWAVIGQERGVIAEPSTATWGGCQATAAATLEDALDAVYGIDVGDHADVLQRAAGGRLTQQLLEVLRVAGVLARIARRAHARSPAEARRGDTRVIGDAHTARRRR